MTEPLKAKVTHVDPRTKTIAELEALLKKNEEILKGPIAKNLKDKGQKLKEMNQTIINTIKEKRANGIEAMEQDTINNLQMYAEYRDKPKTKKEAPSNFIEQDSDVSQLEMIAK